MDYLELLNEKQMRRQNYSPAGPEVMVSPLTVTITGAYYSCTIYILSVTIQIESEFAHYAATRALSFNNVYWKYIYWVYK